VDQLKEIKLDGENRFFDAQKTFGAIAEELKNVIAPKRVITEIFLDGQAVGLIEEEDLNKMKISELGEVELKTRNVSELFRESLKLAPQVCQAMRMDVEDIEGLFSEGQLQVAQERVGELTSLLEWLLQLVSGLQTLGVTKLEDMQFSKGPVMNVVTGMQEILVQMHEDLAAQRWEKFRTQLSGGFTTEIEVWETMFNDVSVSWVPQSNISDQA